MRKSGLILLLSGILGFAVLAQGLPEIPDLGSSFGEDSLGLVLGASGSYDGKAYTVEKGGLSYISPNFSLLALLEMNGDGTFGHGLNIGDNYFLIDAGGMAFHFGDFTLRGGQLPSYDAVDSPYSLFINGTGISTTLGELSFSRGAFSYQTRWIGLNDHNKTENTAVFSSGLYPNRGASLKTYKLKLGDMAIGIQDLAVYSGRYFDLSYFADPMPNYFIQYVNAKSGRPWYSGYDDNNIIGAFWTWNIPEGPEVYAQVLIDDFSVFGSLGSWSNNPWKAAWSFGGSYETKLGKLGFYQAGATKYCFEPTYETIGKEYGYTYYPDTVFLMDGELVAIPFEDMMVGYQHGENNLAFMATWSDTLGGFNLGASCEFTLSGSKSPANAWQEETWTDYSGTKMLDEAVLEKKVLLTLGASKNLGILLLFTQAQLGYVFNELELTSISPVVTDSGHLGTTYSNVPIWKPSATNRILYKLTLGGSIRLGL
jgi:hypothetical protein